MLCIDGVLMFGVFGCLGVFYFRVRACGVVVWCGLLFSVDLLGFWGFWVWGWLWFVDSWVCWFEFLGLTVRGCCGLLVSDVVV